MAEAAEATTGSILRLVARHGGPQLLGSAYAERLLGRFEPVTGTPEERAEALAEDLEGMGPTYVKLAQVLASRPDLIPEPYREALARLHDDVAPLPWEVVHGVLVEELGNVEDHFATVEEAPLAAASIGQVHRARLHDGTAVAVKVQRPGARAVMIGDLASWLRVARLLESGSAAVAAMRPVAILEEARAALIKEFDYEREASNLHRLHELFEDDAHVRVPRVYREHSTPRVLTMEYVEGTKLTSASVPKGRGAVLADAVFAAWMTQILVEGFFHADPHPGNLFLDRRGRVVLLDAGMVGVVPRRLRRGLVKVLLALADGRAEDAAEAFTRLARDTEGADPDRFRDEVAVMVADAAGADLASIRVGALLVEMQRLAVETGIGIPASLTLVGKALLQLDEVGRFLDPTFRAEEAIRRHAAALVESSVSGVTSVPRMLQAMLETEDLAEALPDRVRRILDLAADNRLRVEVTSAALDAHAAEVKASARILAAGLVVAATLVALALLGASEGGLVGWLVGALVLAAGASGALWLAGGLVRRGGITGR